MRIGLLIIATTMVSSPTWAQPRADQGIERALRDPATAQRIDRAMQAVTDSLLAMKVGDAQAALEGRAASPAERALTVGDLDPARAADVRKRIAAAGPAIAKSMTALANALPALTKSMDDIRRTLDRALATMPDPTYPKR